MEDWILYFDEEKYNFSESFKKELNVQLGSKLIANLECETLFKDYFFNLFIGMEEVNIIENEGYIYGDVQIISPDSFSRPITIAWKSDSFEDKLKIHQSETEGKIQFFFCTDFPTDELKKYIKPKKEKAANKLEGKIDIEVDLTTFPDLAVTIDESEKLTTEEKEEIRNIFKRNEAIYVSDFSENLIMLDFQIDSLDFEMVDFKVAESFINDCLALIQNLKFSSKISRIVIE